MNILEWQGNLPSYSGTFEDATKILIPNLLKNFRDIDIKLFDTGLCWVKWNPKEASKKGIMRG